MSKAWACPNADPTDPISADQGEIERTQGPILEERLYFPFLLALIASSLLFRVAKNKFPLNS